MKLKLLFGISIAIFAANVLANVNQQINSNDFKSCKSDFNGMPFEKAVVNSLANGRMWMANCLYRSGGDYGQYNAILRPDVKIVFKEPRLWQESSATFWTCKESSAACQFK